MEAGVFAFKDFEQLYIRIRPQKSFVGGFFYRWTTNIAVAKPATECCGIDAGGRGRFSLVVESAALFRLLELGRASISSLFVRGDERGAGKVDGVSEALIFGTGRRVFSNDLKQTRS